MSRKMTRNVKRSRVQAGVAAAVILVGVFASAGARADDTIKRPGDHPTYSVELEPHGLLDWYTPYNHSNAGFGIGGRFSIPIVQNGFVPSINNSVAISFGIDWVHYDGCYFLGNCSVDYLYFPIVMQWNFFVARRWSVFGEPGIAIYHGFFNDCPFAVNGVGCGGTPQQTGVWPAFYIGGRYHFSDGAALTMRLGFPTLSIGVSSFP
jgi:hypothetical protein